MNASERAIERATELGITIIKSADGTTDCILYADLLNAAHTHGSFKGDKFLGFKPPDIIKLSPSNQECIVIATALFDNDFEVSAIGHTSPENMSSLREHFVTSAETRAKSRALRDALNIYLVSKEELCEIDHKTSYDRNNQKQTNNSNNFDNDDPPKPMTKPQESAIHIYLNKIENPDQIMDNILSSLNLDCLSIASSAQANQIIQHLKKLPLHSNNHARGTVSVSL